MTTLHCASHLTLADYLNSCRPLPLAVSSANPLVIDSAYAVRGMHYNFYHMKNIFAEIGLLEHLKHPATLLQAPVSYTIQDGPPHSPPIMHGLWITNPAHPKKIHPDLEKFIEQTQKLPGYEVVLWTNLTPERLAELNPRLADTSITIKTIADLDSSYTKLLDFALFPQHYLTTRKPNAYNGVLIDLAKYLILEHEGGIMADLNFEFSPTFVPATLAPYDFVAPNRGLNRVENGFIVAKPHHPILQETLDIMENMLFSTDCAHQQFKVALSIMDGITENFSMLPLALAFFKQNNQAGNLDVLTPWLSSCADHAPKPLAPAMLAQLADHERLSSAIDSHDFAHVTDFMESYARIYLNLQSYNYFPCIEASSIGDDKQSVTWWGASLVE